MNLMNLFNQWSVLVLGIWLIAAIGCFGTRNSKPFEYAWGATVLIALGYLITHD